MTLYRKVSGAWVAATEAYVKRSGVWRIVDDAYVKRSGVWTNAFHYDITPPVAPTLTTEIHDNFVGRNGNYINVGIRMPGANNDSGVRRVRVLTTYNGAMPTSQYGGTFHSTAANNWKNEPWSEWRFNGFGSHTDTSVITTKRFPVNDDGHGWLTKGRKYHFAAWAEDFYGNWSNATTATVTGTGADPSANIITKHASFQANDAGSYTSSGWQAGILRQNASPRSNGFFLYGNQITEAIGQTGDRKNIKSAQIRLTRYADNGSAAANVYLFWHSYHNSGEVTGTEANMKERTYIGTISKGETKWFSIPLAMLERSDGYFDENVHGFGLFYRNPAKASAFANDYSEIEGVAANVRAGELQLTWTEHL